MTSMPESGMPESGRVMTLDDVDPFERFNRAIGRGRIVDPYGDIRAERELHFAPFRVGRADHIGDDAIRAVSFEAVEEVLRDGTRFSSSIYGDVVGDVFGRSILEMDEPEHHSYR